MEMTDNHTLEKNSFQYITLNKENIDKEHICCAFSDKKCSEGYELKKQCKGRRVAFCKESKRVGYLVE